MALTILHFRPFLRPPVLDFGQSLRQIFSDISYFPCFSDGDCLFQTSYRQQGFNDFIFLTMFATLTLCKSSILLDFGQALGRWISRVLSCGSVVNVFSYPEFGSPTFSSVCASSTENVRHIIPYIYYESSTSQNHMALNFLSTFSYH